MLKKCGCSYGTWETRCMFGVRFVVRSIRKCGHQHGVRSFLTFDEVRDSENNIVGFGYAPKVVIENYFNESWA